MDRYRLRPPPQDLATRLKLWAREDGVRDLELDEETAGVLFHILTNQIYRFNEHFRRIEVPIRFSLVGRIRIGDNFIKLVDRFSGRTVSARLEVAPDYLRIGHLTIMAGAASRRLVAIALINLADELAGGATEAA